MKIGATDDNIRLARVVNTRLSADARMIKARAALWVLGGIGLAAFGVGAGAALAILSYARLNDKSTAAREIADVLAATLQNVKLTATIDPSSIVKLDPDSAVKISPGGEVTAKGMVSVSGSVPADIPRPTQRQLNTSAAPESKARVTTDYTVFKTVDFAGGAVVTGYNFSPDADAPKAQYCYFAEGVGPGDASLRINLAKDGIYAPPKPRLGFDPQAAASNCVWFDGRRTAF